MKSGAVGRMFHRAIAVSFLTAMPLLPARVSGSTPGYTWTLMQSGTAETLNDIDGTVYDNDLYDLWAVGNNGTILNYRNNMCTRYIGVTTVNLYSVYYQNQGAVWAIGDDGTILFYDSSYDTWFLQAGAPAGSTLTGVSGYGGAYADFYDSIWAVGATSTSPVILRFNLPPYGHPRNGTWVQEASPAAMAINDVAAIGRHDAWAVGTGEGIIHCNPNLGTLGTWVTVQPPVLSQDLFSICGEGFAGGDRLWAGGDSGTPLYYCNGSHWTTETNSFGNILGMDSDSYDIAAWAVGDMGLIYSYKNTATPWKSIFQPGVTLRGVCHLTDRSIWVVGDDGVIFRGTSYLGSNYMDLTLSQQTIDPGEDFHLYYNCHTAEWDYQGVPVNIYLAYIVNSTISDEAATVAETLNSGDVFIFTAGMGSSYLYTGTLLPPTFGNVRMPPVDSSGSLNLKISSSSLPGTITFATVFVRRDNGKFVRTDYPAEISPMLTVQ